MTCKTRSIHHLLSQCWCMISESKILQHFRQSKCWSLSTMMNQWAESTIYKLRNLSKTRMQESQSQRSRSKCWLSKERLNSLQRDMTLAAHNLNWSVFISWRCTTHSNSSTPSSHTLERTKERKMELAKRRRSRTKWMHLRNRSKKSKPQWQLQLLLRLKHPLR